MCISSGRHYLYQLWRWWRILLRVLEADAVESNSIRWQTAQSELLLKYMDFNLYISQFSFEIGTAVVAHISSNTSFIDMMSPTNLSGFWWKPPVLKATIWWITVFLALKPVKFLCYFLWHNIASDILHIEAFFTCSDYSLFTYTAE